MKMRDAIRAGLAAKRLPQAEADAAERRKARKAAGKTRRREVRGPAAIACRNCGTDPLLGCTSCPAERFADA